MVGDEMSVVVLAAQPALTGACDLCARGETALRATVAVQHASDASASFEICEFCERAIRRLAAATHGVTRFVTGEPGVRVASESPDAAATAGAAAQEPD